MGDKLIPVRSRNAIMDLAQDGKVRTVAKLLEIKHAHIVWVSGYLYFKRLLISVSRERVVPFTK